MITASNLSGREPTSIPLAMKSNFKKRTKRVLAKNRAFRARAFCERAFCEPGFSATRHFFDVHANFLLEEPSGFFAFSITIFWPLYIDSKLKSKQLSSNFKQFTLCGNRSSSHLIHPYITI
jgi:hypothetical protein